MVKIQIEIFTTFGNFKSKEIILELSKIDEFQNMSREYYKTGLELDLEDDSFIIFPPEVIKNSIFKINKTYVQ
jgi:hypothetical protein